MDETSYRKKVMGCWLGKAVGGTLGQPYEGSAGPLALSYYDPVPTDMVPNDDLDLQVLWCCILAGMERPVVDRDVFARGWLEHVDFPWDEYALAIRNLKQGIRPPWSGQYDNYFRDGLGAAIRSELWACLAPDDPERAARFAYEDACVDHAGDGIYAEQFWAAAESRAFTVSDLDRLLDTGLSVIPGDCRLARAVADVRKLCAVETDPLKIRRHVLDNWGAENFTDTVMNTAFAVMALILGKGDFSKSICLAVNCGQDADCSTATAGAILGLIDPDSIDPKWLKPIGHKLILNDGIRGIRAPSTLEGFSDMIFALRERIALRGDVAEEREPDLTAFAVPADCGFFKPWFAHDEGRFSPRLPEVTQRRVFPGCFAGIANSEIAPDGLFMMRFRFELDAPRKARVMFNCNGNHLVWIDGDYAFGREGGRMAPSFHRAPRNQFKDLALSAGKHEILVGLARTDRADEIRWVIGVAEQGSKQWIPVRWF